MHAGFIKTETSLTILLRQATWRMRAATVASYARCLKFNPNQPRVPRGRREGGQWTRGDFTPTTDVDADDTSLRPVIRISDEDPPEVPRPLPAKPGDRYRLARTIAIRLLRLSPQIRTALIAARIAGLVDELAHDFVAYWDAPKMLAELQDAVGNGRKGYDDHHIVEQTPARRDRFPEKMIRSRENVVRIPRFRHWEINEWYSVKQEQYGFMSPREYLRGRSWEERYAVGIEALRRHGVLNDEE